jgi:hypothetical protein
MSKCEICGSEKDVAPRDVKPIILAARRKHALCESCYTKLLAHDPETIFKLADIIGRELLQKMP